MDFRHFREFALDAGPQITAPRDAGDQRSRVGAVQHLKMLGNCELHERTTLAASLNLSARLDHTSDSDLLLCAYTRWGFALVDHLEGQFAFAICDSRLKIVFACTDHLGTLPLFFAFLERGSRLRIASDMVSMLDHFDGTLALNVPMLAASMRPTFYSPPAGETFHKDIHCLPEGSCLIADARGWRVTRYWRPSIRPELVPTNDDEVYEKTRELVEQAVANRIGKKQKVAIRLSGGLDSSALAAVAARYLRTRNQTLIAAVGVNDPVNHTVPDERPFATQLGAFDNIELNFVSAAGQGPFDMLDDAKDLETAVGNPHAVYIPRALTALAESRGAELILSGIFGEFTVSSYPEPFFLGLLKSLQWATFRRELKAVGGGKAVSGLRLLAREIVQHMRQRPTGPLCFFPAPGFLVRNQQEWVRRTPWLPDPRATLLADLSQYLDRNSYVKTCSPSRVLSPSCPFMDKNLLEFCLALPAHYKRRDGYNRYLVRRAFSKMLPCEIAWRRGKMRAHPDYFYRFNTQLEKGRAFLAEIKDSDPVGEIIDLPRLKTAMVPVQNPDKVHSDALWAIPHSMRVIGFLRQFAGFRA